MDGVNLIQDGTGETKKGLQMQALLFLRVGYITRLDYLLRVVVEFRAFDGA